VVAHACNPSHSGGAQFKSSPGKKLEKPLSVNKQSVVVYDCDASCGGGISRRIMV
jgi:hypothetical protein